MNRPQLVANETAREDLKNALQILRGIGGVPRTEAEIAGLLTAVYRRIETAVAKVGTFERRIRPHTLPEGVIAHAIRELL